MAASDSRVRDLALCGLCGVVIVGILASHLVRTRGQVTVIIRGNSPSHVYARNNLDHLHTTNLTRYLNRTMVNDETNRSTLVNVQTEEYFQRKKVQGNNQDSSEVMVTKSETAHNSHNRIVQDKKRELSHVLNRQDKSIFGKDRNNYIVYDGSNSKQNTRDYTTFPGYNSSSRVATDKRDTRIAPPTNYHEHLNKIRPDITTKQVENTNWTSPPDCKLLFQGLPSELRRVQIQKLSRSSPRLTALEILESTRDCASYIRTKGYITASLSREEADFPLAYGIRMHYKVEQAERLLRVLYRPQNVYCLYVDRKAHRDVHSAIRGIASCFNNVFMAAEVHDYVYQSFSPVQADLQCMKQLLASPVEWKYFLNLAGTEFPLKTNLEIVRILKVLNGSNDIEQYPYPKIFKERVAFKYRVVDHDLVRTTAQKEQFKEGNVTLQKGCSYNSFSRAFVEWVLTDKLARSFINWTKDLHSPDEVVWASLNNHPRAPGGYSEMVTQISKMFLSRIIVWQGMLQACPGKRYVHGICIFSAGSLQWLANRWELFANKFDTEYDRVVLDCLEQSLDYRTRHPDPDTGVNWRGVYRAPHVKTQPPPGMDLV